MTCQRSWEVARAASLKIIKDGFGQRLPQGDAFYRAFAANLFLHAIELGDPPYGLFSNGGTLRRVHIHELASDMGHAGHLTRLVGAEHAVEAGIAICMHPALVT